MTIYQYPDYMYHYGVIGMKWGQRRTKIRSHFSQTKQRIKNYKMSDKTKKRIAIGVAGATAIAGTAILGMKAQDLILKSEYEKYRKKGMNAVINLYNVKTTV